MPSNGTILEAKSHRTTQIALRFAHNCKKVIVCAIQLVLQELAPFDHPELLRCPCTTSCLSFSLSTVGCAFEWYFPVGFIALAKTTVIIIITIFNHRHVRTDRDVFAAERPGRD